MFFKRTFATERTTTEPRALKIIKALFSVFWLLVVLTIFTTSAYAADTDGDGVDDSLEGYGVMPDGTLISTALGGTGVSVDGTAWETVLATLPSSQVFVESFESFTNNTPLDGLTSPGAFSLDVTTFDDSGNVVNGVENDVDGSQYGTSPRTGSKQATFSMDNNNVTHATFTFTKPVTGFGLYLGDIHDGNDVTRFQNPS